jgi:lipopolysaccharide transport system ATP-binding protein
MSEIAISVDGISKRYRIGEKRDRYLSLREVIAKAAASPVRKAGSLIRGQAYGAAGLEEEIWALRDVSFEVRHGEVLGIIGRNGAGKTTLLKILSRITEPTSGVADIYGRVGSLLEVGTGMHPELTGRENIFLNGAVLGMKKSEIERKFDEIVDFSGVEKFIDTPLKHYSTGMQVRLAFSVAAHLEPEILLVDEVLAVGDMNFQKKCLGKMDEVARGGRTVFFVSHQMNAVSRLCERTILLEDGELRRDGPTHEVIGYYLRSGQGTTASRVWKDPLRAPGNEIVRLRAMRVVREDGELCETIDIRGPVTVEMEYEVLQPGYTLVPNLHFYNDEGTCVFITIDTDPAWRRKPKPVGTYLSRVLIPGNTLAEGGLMVSAAISTYDPVIVHFYEPEAIAFLVVDSLDGDSTRGDYAGNYPGVVRPWLQWTTEPSGGMNGAI